MPLIAGVDEAGRGALAGPVYAAAVILPPRARIRGLNDSKKLVPEERERLDVEIRKRTLACAVAWATTEEVDALNILRASLLAMARAIEALAPAPSQVLVDGCHKPPIALPCKTVIGGDGIHPCIMAASILAKVARDAEMRRLDGEYPAYGFAQHKGYGTPEHLEVLRLHGPCAIHRRTFEPVRQLDLPLPDPSGPSAKPTGARRDERPLDVRLAPARPPQAGEGTGGGARVPSPESRVP